MILYERISIKRWWTRVAWNVIQEIAYLAKANRVACCISREMFQGKEKGGSFFPWERDRNITRVQADISLEVRELFTMRKLRSPGD